ncbi:hypothetical protein H4582DRAFT_2081109 [Lactarius indigo]|nr:hypothetical protein H4582DRAFT_2081109 [Lactarius indigo]
MPQPPTRHHAATTWGPRPRLLQLNTTPPPYGTQDPAAVAAGLHATPVRRAGPRHHRPSAPPQCAHHHRRHDPNTPRKNPPRAVKTRYRRPSTPPQRAHHHWHHDPNTPRKSPPRAVKTRHHRPSAPPQRANHHRCHAPSTPRKSPPRAVKTPPLLTCHTTSSRHARPATWLQDPGATIHATQDPYLPPCFPHIN